MNRSDHVIHYSMITMIFSELIGERSMLNLVDVTRSLENVVKTKNYRYITCG